MMLTRRGLMVLAGGSLPVLALFPRMAAAADPTPLLAPAVPQPLTPPAEIDDDLVSVGEKPLAEGPVLLLVGRVSDLAGAPVSEARVEIWQADAAGRWLAAAEADVDPNFQGSGRTETDTQGLYRFRTIRPGASHDRAAHIGFAVSGPGFNKLITSIYFADDTARDQDKELVALPEASQKRLIAPLRPVPDSSPDTGAMAVRFDVTVPLNRTLKG